MKRVPARNLEHPGPARVRRIAELEQEVWGGPSIVGRIDCETGGKFTWSSYNSSSGASGVLQFLAGTWAAMWPGTPQDVRWVLHERRRRAPIVLWQLWADGSKTHEVVGHRRQRVRVILRATLPENPGPDHVTAAIRVGQRAVSGDGPSTSWECEL